VEEHGSQTNHHFTNIGQLEFVTKNSFKIYRRIIVVLVKILSIQPVNSPLYDLGYNEEEICKKWKKILDI